MHLAQFQSQIAVLIGKNEVKPLISASSNKNAKYIYIYAFLPALSVMSNRWCRRMMVGVCMNIYVNIWIQVQNIVVDVLSFFGLCCLYKYKHKYSSQIKCFNLELVNQCWTHNEEMDLS